MRWRDTIGRPRGGRAAHLQRDVTERPHVELRCCVCSHQTLGKYQMQKHPDAEGDERCRVQNRHLKNLQKVLVQKQEVLESRRSDGRAPPSPLGSPETSRSVLRLGSGFQRNSSLFVVCLHLMMFCQSRFTLSGSGAGLGLGLGLGYTNSCCCCSSAGG